MSDSLSDGWQEVFLADESAALAWAAAFAQTLHAGHVIALYGDLGAGKTTISRGILRTLGETGAIKSPTYSLCEPYEDIVPPTLHLDLYRLSSAEELLYLGLPEDAQDYLWLVEWPEKGQGMLPPWSIEIHLSYAGTGRNLRWRFC